MPTSSRQILVVNSGSSSIKFALYAMNGALTRGLHGSVDHIGSDHAILRSRREDHALSECRDIAAPDHATAAQGLRDWLTAQPEYDDVEAIGHRVVHGMQHVAPERVTPELLQDLHHLAPYDPDHLPGEIALIEAFTGRDNRGLPQIACFDTAFHSGMPRVASMLPIPRCYEAQGLRRYGFHGLSYAYLMEELARVAGPAAAGGRVVLAHLGNGASLAAVHRGVSIDTSMGFTPTSGLVMSTRCGDLDPGVSAYLDRSEHIGAQTFYAMLNHQSGLLGISETSGDMQALLAVEAQDVRAAEAVALFCYQARKFVGAYAAALGGIDTLIFSGGIGENAPTIRARICDRLAFLGIAVDPLRNMANESVISEDGSAVTVRMIHTDEALMIARSVCCALGISATAP